MYMCSIFYLYPCIHCSFFRSRSTLRLSLICRFLITVMSLYFFFFKKKTAYEMRISDWSSDVCSSDLFIFVNLERNPSVSLEEFLGGMGDYLKGIQYKYADNPITIEAHLDCNWKVACDAFSEAYHIPAIHANTIGKTFSSQDNKFAHILGANFFGPHRIAALSGNPDYIPGEEDRKSVV